ncbi:hypothetical protein AB0D27_03000 [Streptomyces sp. NPDC048415]|uniref:hypothetical protein n=1 Tax=Streptomyces sp. NPDC048415 TaxID=3154822 RepID=UPI003422A4CB
MPSGKSSSVPRAVGGWDSNPGAVCFWRSVAAEIASGAWVEERRPVPGRPDLPPDVWISF